jgi:hypothetical protein
MVGRLVWDLRAYIPRYARQQGARVELRTDPAVRFRT